MRKLLATLALCFPLCAHAQSLGTGAIPGPNNSSQGTGTTPNTPTPQPTATPLVFGTPGELVIFGSPELGRYAGTSCASGFATALDALGVASCATPVPPTPLPTATPGASGGYALIQDEGTPLPVETKFNCIGDLIACADDAGSTRTNVNITNPTAVPTATPAFTATPAPTATPPPFTGGNVVATPLTTNFIPKAVGATTISDSTLSDNTTSIATSSTTGYASKMVNDTITGTTQNKLVKQSGGKAIITATTDTAGVLGICDAGCATTGSASIITTGPASCVFDNSVTQGNFFGISSSVAGDCTDIGTAITNAVAILGIITNANAAAGTRTVWFNGPDSGANITNIKGSGGKIGVAAGTAGQVQYSLGSGQFGASSFLAIDSTSTPHALDTSGSNSGLADVFAISHTITNTSTGTNAAAVLSLNVSGSATQDADPYIRFFKSGAPAVQWSLGQDTSAGDAFVLDPSEHLTTSPTLKVLRTGGVLQIATVSSATNPDYSFLGDPDTGFYSTGVANTWAFANGGTQTLIGRTTGIASDITLSGGIVEWDIDNLSNTANSNALLQIFVGGGSAGDPVVGFRVSGGTAWSIGTDNSDSDKWKLSQATNALGTNDTIVAEGTTLNVLTPGGGVMPKAAAIASAPTCDSSHKGMRATATDCNAACTFGGTCTTGGTTVCPLYCDGSAWLEG